MRSGETARVHEHLEAIGFRTHRPPGLRGIDLGNQVLFGVSEQVFTHVALFRQARQVHDAYAGSEITTRLRNALGVGATRGVVIGQDEYALTAEETRVVIAPLTRPSATGVGGHGQMQITATFAQVKRAHVVAILFAFGDDDFVGGDDFGQVVEHAPRIAQSVGPAPAAEVLVLWEILFFVLLMWIADDAEQRAPKFILVDVNALGPFTEPLARDLRDVAPGCAVITVAEALFKLQ